MTGRHCNSARPQGWRKLALLAKERFRTRQVFEEEVNRIRLIPYAARCSMHLIDGWGICICKRSSEVSGVATLGPLPGHVTERTILRVRSHSPLRRSSTPFDMRVGEAYASRSQRGVFAGAIREWPKQLSPKQKHSTSLVQQLATKHISEGPICVAENSGGRTSGSPTGSKPRVVLPLEQRYHRPWRK